MKAFKEAHGRTPTMDEIKDTLRKVAAQQAAGGEEDESEGAEEEQEDPEEEQGEEEDEEEEQMDASQVMDLLIAEYQSRNGGQLPDEAALAQWREALASAQPGTAAEVHEEEDVATVTASTPSALGKRKEAGVRNADAAATAIEAAMESAEKAPRVSA